MKRIFCLLLCAIFMFSCLTACADDVGITYQNGLFSKDGYLYNLSEKVTPDAFLSANPEFSDVTSSNGKYVGTGDIASDLSGNAFTVVVRGDLDGNGEVAMYDYFMVKSAYFGKYELSALQLKAVDAQGGELDMYDYLSIKTHYFEKFDLYGEPNNYLKNDCNGVKIAYIPLDNRPVNKDRVEYLAQSAGFTLLLPDEQLYRTALDNMTPNDNGLTYGDREALLAWLKSVEDECDYFVVSLDQMFSGGLVGSRYLSNTDLTLETEIADYLIGLSREKYVVYYDTVMRLASTVGYQGYEMSEYNALRAYGQVARKTLSGDELTVENIVSGYRCDENGEVIDVNVTDEQLDLYLASRTRKLKIIDYLLTNASEDIERLYVGVDDSSPQVTIQTNEINYISSIAGDNFTLFAGADELGLMGIAAVTSACYGQANCNVTYYGEGKDYPADDYDTGTLSENVEKHLLSVGATVTSNDPDALQVLVLTKSDSLSANVDKLIAQMRSNIESGVPTCVINASGNGGALAEKMLSADCNLAMLLGYSQWNTVGNAVGISVSNAVSRYLYLYHCENITEASHQGFLKSFTFALVKDISYKYKGYTDLSSSALCGAGNIVVRINNSKIMTGRNVSSKHGNVSVSNLRYPWNRSFEATFDISVSD